MTSEQIDHLNSASDICVWLQEIAKQLAVMNEHNANRDAHALENETLRFQAMIATIGGAYVPKDTSL